MRNLSILMKKDFIELIRTKKVLILSLVFLLFAMSSPLLAFYMPQIIASVGGELQGLQLPDPSITDSYTQFASNISQLCAYVLLVLYAGQIVTERKKGQLTTLMNNGVTKAQFVLSKVFSQILLLTGIYLLSIVFLEFYNFVLFDDFLVKHTLQTYFALYIYLIFVIALVNFFSSLAKSNVMSISFSFITVILLSIFDLFSFGRFMPNYLISLSVKVLSDKDVLLNLYQTSFITLGISILLVGLSVELCRTWE